MKIKSIKIGTLILFLLIIIFGNSIFDMIIKRFDFYGEKFNIERKISGLETLNKNWKIDFGINENFKILWINTNKNENHDSKVIEFGYFGPKTEIDSYYSNKSTFYTKYDFKKKKFEYFKEMCSGGIGMDTKISEKEFQLKIKE